MKKELSDEAGPVARRVPADRIILPRKQSSRNDASQLLSSITTALDPATQAARDHDRESRSMNMTQILTMRQTLRDAQLTIESLRTQLQQAQNERNEARREADRSEMRALIERGLGQSSRPRYNPSSPSSARLQRERHSYYNTPRRSPLQYYPFSPSHNSRRPFPETPVARYSRPQHRGESPAPRQHIRSPTPAYTVRHISGPSHSRANSTWHQSPAHRDSRASPDRRVRRETFFANGGRRVDWIGGSDNGDGRHESISPGTICYTVNPLTPPASSANAVSSLPESDKLYNTSVQPNHSP